MNNRVVITGMGAITPLEIQLKILDVPMQRKNGVDKITKFDVSDFSTQIAACVKDFNPEIIWIKRKPEEWTDIPILL